jgi:Zn-dependent protease with chaperone function
MSDKKKSGSKDYAWIFFVYLIFLIAAIPWYWSKDNSLIILGLPAWVFVAILVSICTSIFTAFLLLRYPWKMEVDADE